MPPSGNSNGGPLVVQQFFEQRVLILNFGAGDVPWLSSKAHTSGSLEDPLPVNLNTEWPDWEIIPCDSHDFDGVDKTLSTRRR